MTIQFSVEDNRAWQKPFFTLWTLQSFSLVGTSLVQFAIAWYLTIQTDSATVLATALMVGLLPGVFLSPFSGVLVDRWNRKLIILISDSTVALLTAILALLFYSGVVEIWHIYVVLFLRAVAGSFHQPALTSTTSLMVPKEHLTRIQGLNQTVSGVLLMLSPPLGALLVDKLPMQGILAIDMVTALMACVALIFVAVPRPKRETTSSDSDFRVLQDLKIGFEYILKWRGLLILTLSWTFLFFMFAPMVSLMPLLVKNHFGGNAYHLGWMTLAYGIGMTLGGITLGLWGGFKKRIITSIISTICIGLGDVVLGLTTSNMYLVALGTQVWVGFMVSFGNAAASSIMQAKVKPDMQGRVFSLSSSLSSAVSPLSLMIAGPVADWLSVQFWILTAGIACTLMGIAQFFIRPVMRIEEEQPGIRDISHLSTW